MTAHELPNGIKVRYHHRRNLRPYTGPPKMDAFWDAYQVHTVDPRGGTTIAEILRDDVVIARGEARCHPKDNYNKAIGRRIALGRALKNLREGRRFHTTQSSAERIRVAIARQVPVYLVYTKLDGERKAYEGTPLRIVSLSNGPGVQFSSYDGVLRTLYLDRISDVEPIDY